MKNIFNGFIISGFTWFTFIGSIKIFQTVGQSTGYKAIFGFAVAAFALILSICQMWSIGADLDIAEKAKKLSKEMEARKNDLPKV